MSNLKILRGFRHRKKNYRKFSEGLEIEDCLFLKIFLHKPLTLHSMPLSRFKHPETKKILISPVYDYQYILKFSESDDFLKIFAGI